MHEILTRRAAIQWTGAVLALPVAHTAPGNLENGRMPFTPKFVDLVRNLTSVQGTGPVTLGQAVSGYTGIAQAMSAGDQFYYCIQGVDKPQEREVGRGTLQADGRVAREPIGGAATSFTSGTKTIALVTAAEWFAKLEAAGAGGGSIGAANRAALAAVAADRGPAMLTERGREGLFVFVPGDQSAKVAIDPRQGLHVPPASDPTGASGAWVRAGWSEIDCAWFGLAGDDAADDAPAINAAFAVAEALGFTVDYGWATPPVRLRKGKYYCASSLVPQQTTKFVGDGGKGDAGGAATEIRFAANCHGIDLRSDPGIRAPSIALEGLHLRGAYTNFASEGDYHGVNARVRFRARDVIVDNFQGDGFNIDAGAEAGNSFLENANNFVIEDCWAAGCRFGFYIIGADANAGRLVGCSAIANRRWGFFDNSFLGNTHIGHHTSDNGTYLPGGEPPTVVSHGGNRYCVAYGQDVGARTNAPSGTVADNSYWLFVEGGGPSVGGGYNIPAWSSGMTLRSGGSYFADGTNGGMAFINCYAEGGQGHNQFGQSTFVMHGQMPRRTIGSLYATNEGLKAKSLSVDGPLSSTGVFQLGPQSASGADGLAFLNSGLFSYTLQARTFFDDSGTYVGSLSFAYGSGVNYNVDNAGWAHKFRVNGADVATINNAGLSLASGKTLKVNGIAVVGAQGAAVADATDAASAVTQLNALLARCRAHGLIAT